MVASRLTGVDDLRRFLTMIASSGVRASFEALEKALANSNLKQGADSAEAATAEAALMTKQRFDDFVRILAVQSTLSSVGPIGSAGSEHFSTSFQNQCGGLLRRTLSSLRSSPAYARAIEASVADHQNTVKVCLLFSVICLAYCIRSEIWCGHCQFGTFLLYVVCRDSGIVFYFTNTHSRPFSHPTTTSCQSRRSRMC